MGCVKDLFVTINKQMLFQSMPPLFCLFVCCVSEMLSSKFILLSLFLCFWFYNDQVLPSLREKRGESFLEEFVRSWSNHKVMVTRLSEIFHYLDRYFVKWRSIPNLMAVGLSIFRDLVSWFSSFTFITGCKHLKVDNYNNNNFFKIKSKLAILL